MSRYLIDSSVLITCANGTPIEYFPSFWNRMDSSIRKGQILISDVVVEEISQKMDLLKKWLGMYKSLYVKTSRSDVLIETKLIINKYKNLIDLNNPNDQADPYIIGLAKVDDLCVICEEKYSESTLRAKIPFVCKKEGVECINRLDFFKREGWKF